ncbi:type II toxin-antitoxin system RelE/ParE family toxin [Bifidobacterium moukalabense]|uniref:type II toxin-antitoxin system RelE/ParE family toxin n=1 Tax=Bifidobacterium moukalabense TaxID=1333651 RepID=UPI0010F6315A|nr:type II toxin-antitoxin system YafQ family toxin [Bifidobacterium moukalabense]
MYEIDSHSREFDKDFKRLARYDRALARELVELMSNGRVPDSYRPHVLDNPGGLYNGCMEFHLADDVLVLYYPPTPRDVIHLRVIRTHEELSTGRYSREWPTSQSE